MLTYDWKNNFGFAASLDTKAYILSVTFLPKSRRFSSWRILHADARFSFCIQFFCNKKNRLSLTIVNLSFCIQITNKYRNIYPYKQIHSTQLEGQRERAIFYLNKFCSIPMILYRGN